MINTVSKSCAHSLLTFQTGKAHFKQKIWPWLFLILVQLSECADNGTRLVKHKEGCGLKVCMITHGLL